mmetsp:Transcript_78441/g.253674  ORF Transcript_78441/g.253674 Transcript_78441/m.253674 type:complete len:267 (+) Transcript_78441:1269-2069(+)
MNFMKTELSGGAMYPTHGSMRTEEVDVHNATADNWNSAGHTTFCFSFRFAAAASSSARWLTFWLMALIHFSKDSSSMAAASWISLAASTFSKTNFKSSQVRPDSRTLGSMSGLYFAAAHLMASAGGAGSNFAMKASGSTIAASSSTTSSHASRIGTMSPICTFCAFSWGTSFTFKLQMAHFFLLVDVRPTRPSKKASGSPVAASSSVTEADLRMAFVSSHVKACFFTLASILPLSAFSAFAREMDPSSASRSFAESTTSIASSSGV